MNIRTLLVWGVVILVMVVLFAALSGMWFSFTMIEPAGRLETDSSASPRSARSFM
jgi:hypothetical protein